MQGPPLISGPFRIDYLNVGSRRFRLSLEGIAALVKQQRPDILILADVGATRAHIGRLRQRLEAELDDEWFIWTDISASPGYPIGMGAVMHCSLTHFISKIELPCPAFEHGDMVWSSTRERLKSESTYTSGSNFNVRKSGLGYFRTVSRRMMTTYFPSKANAVSGVENGGNLGKVKSSTFGPQVFQPTR